MLDSDAEADAASMLLERRWFAAMNAARKMRAECDALREVMELSEKAWWRARKVLARLELLRDVLEDELNARDADYGRSMPGRGARAVSTAA